MEKHSGSVTHFGSESSAYSAGLLGHDAVTCCIGSLHNVKSAVGCRVAAGANTPQTDSLRLPYTLHNACTVTQREKEEVVHRFALVRHSFQQFICQDSPTYCIDSWQWLSTKELLNKRIWHLHLTSLSLRYVLVNNLFDCCKVCCHCWSLMRLLKASTCCNK